jgi:hypothetical protein
MPTVLDVVIDTVMPAVTAMTAVTRPAMPAALPAGPLVTAIASVPGGLLAGAVLVAAVRTATALAEARLRAGDCPLWRCGRAVPALVGHDVAIGLAGYALLAVLPARLATSLVDPALFAVLGSVLTLALSGPLLRRRRGLPLAAIGHPGAFAQEPMMTWRARLLARVERSALRVSARWIAERLDACRRRASVTDEQLLPAVWTPGRIRLRETVGVGRTEVALLLLQAQAVVDDASPPQERLLTLLHLIHDRAGRRGVRSVLEQAVRGPLRHGRAGMPTWGPGAVPGPMATAPANPFPTAAPTP